MDVVLELLLRHQLRVAVLVLDVDHELEVLVVVEESDDGVDLRNEQVVLLGKDHPLALHLTPIESFHPVELEKDFRDVFPHCVVFLINERPHVSHRLLDLDVRQEEVVLQPENQVRLE